MSETASRAPPSVKKEKEPPNKEQEEEEEGELSEDDDQYELTNEANEKEETRSGPEEEYEGEEGEEEHEEEEEEEMEEEDTLAYSQKRHKPTSYSTETNTPEEGSLSNDVDYSDVDKVALELSDINKAQSGINERKFAKKQHSQQPSQQQRQHQQPYRYQRQSYHPPGVSTSPLLPAPKSTFDANGNNSNNSVFYGNGYEGPHQRRPPPKKTNFNANSKYKYVANNTANATTANANRYISFLNISWRRSHIETF